MDHPEGKSITQRTLDAAQWRFLSSVVGAGLQLGVGVLLARLLPPEDFGLLALALIFTGLARLVSNLGLAPAVVQRRDLTQAHVRVAFTLSTLLGLVVAGLLVVGAPYATLVFDRPELPDILRFVSLTFLFTGVGNTAGALLRRDLDFRRIFMIDIASYLFGYAAVGVGMALSGFGVWSLVVGTVAQRVVETAVLLSVVRHPMVPLIRKDEARDLTVFGVGVSLSEITGYFASQGDNFVIGRWLGASALGLYTRAFGLMTVPQQYFGSVITTVLFPAMSQVQEEPERVGRAYLRSVELTVLVAAPVLTGMLVAGPHLIVGLYGARWSGAILPLQLLCLAGTFRAVYPLGTSVANAMGRVYAVFLRSALYASLVVGLGYLGSNWGVAGVAVGVGVAVLAMYLMMGHLSLGLVGSGWRTFLRAHAPGGLVALEVLAASVLVRALLEAAGMPSIVIFLALAATGALTLTAGVRTLPGSLHPTGILESLDSSLARLPPVARRVIRFVMGLPTGAHP